MLRYTQYTDMDGKKHIVIWRQLHRKVWNVMEVTL